MTYLNRIGFIATIIFLHGCTFSNQEIKAENQKKGHRLYFDKPAVVDIDSLNKNDEKTRGKVFMGQALPIGNGRLGAMFSGGVDKEYIVFNEISLWMNTYRGLNEVAQSGTPINGAEHLEIVRKAARDRQFGKGDSSVEALGTKYLSSKRKIGNYAPFADLIIDTSHELQSSSNYRRELDINNGVGLVTYNIDDITYKREYFCSYPDDLCSIRLTAKGAEMQLNLSVATVHKKKSIVAKNNSLSLHGFSPLLEGGDAEFLQKVQVEVDKGQVLIEGEHLKVSGASEVIIYVAGYTDYLPEYPDFNGRDFESDTISTLNKATSKGYDAIKNDHIADVQRLMQRVEFDLTIEPSHLPTDKLIEQGKPLALYPLYFNYARYLHISSSRNADLPSNLQGLWNTLEKPPWNSDYHTDINIQMNYWMAETTNLAETFKPYVNWIKVLAESGQHTAKETFGVNNGWTVGLNTNVYGFTAQNEHGRRMQQGGHWVAQHLFEHYSFNKNLEYLNDVYSVQKGACDFFVDHVAPWKDGSLLVYPTWSPENFFLREDHGHLNKQAWGASYDQQLLVNLFTDCIEASIVLNKDLEFRNTLRNIIPRLTPQKINTHGMIQEWPEDLDDPKNTHRHLSHLIALHPGRDISPFTTPKLSAAAEKLMTARVKRGEWAAAWRSALWARLRNGDEALSYLDDLVFTQKSINMLNGNPWQIDGNLGAAAAVSEMLLQSHLRSTNPAAKLIEDAAFVAYKEDPNQRDQFIAVVPPESLVDAPYIIDLLPALPTKWSTGKIKGLRARGGFIVDIVWSKGKLVNATITAEVGGTFRVYANGKLSNEITLEQGKSIIWS